MDKGRDFLGRSALRFPGFRCSYRISDMTTRKLPLLILLPLLLLMAWGCTEDLGPGKFASSLSPQSPPTEEGWNIKSSYQLSIGNDSAGMGGGTDSQGSVYSVGYGMSSGVKSWIVRKSLDQGRSWMVVDQFNYSPGQESVALGFAADKIGNIFVVGSGVVNLGTPQYYWIVRKSSNGGSTWQTVDAVTGATGFYNEASAIAVNSSGRIFVTGVIHNGTKFEWPVRTSSDGGNNWSAAGTYSALSHARGYAVAVGANDHIFMCGTVTDGNNKTHWHIAKSENNGGAWTQVDDYQMQTQGDAECRVLATDRTGRIFAGGSAVSAQNGKHWIVKRSNLDGSMWLIRDDFVHPSDSMIDANSSARSIAFDSSNNVYVSGFGSTFLGSQKYISIVRKSVNGGSTWETEDAYQPMANRDDALGNSIVIDSQDRVFVSGQSWLGSWAWFIRGPSN